MKKLFIIGAMRSGSSSIASYLKQHPSVYDSRVKEPNFMIYHNHEQKYLRSDGSVMELPNYATELEHYKDLYSNMDEGALAIDASSSYISYRQAAENIKALYPDAYILVTLREPIERAVSAYKFNRARGTELRTDFMKILEDEIAEKDSEIFAPWRYIHCGRYEQNLKPYFERFSKDRMYIQSFDDFKEDPLKALTRISEFLGLEDFQYDSSHKVNSSAAPNSISQLVNRALIRNSPPIKLGKKIIKDMFPNISTVKVLAKIENADYLSDNSKAVVTLDGEKEMLAKVFSSQKSIKAIIRER